MTDNKRKRRKTEESEQKPEGIKLDKKFRVIPLDDINVELQEYTKHETKETDEKPSEIIYTWDFTGYYGSIPSAIKAYCKLRCNRAKDTKDLMIILEDIHKNIDNMFEVKTDGKDHDCKCKGKRPAN